jgi:hypothetical protein
MFRLTLDYLWSFISAWAGAINLSLVLVLVFLLLKASIFSQEHSKGPATVMEQIQD